jgi:chemotaxis protein MotA
VIAIPLADKLTLRKTNEGKLMSMCIDGVLGIQSGQNPRILESMLKTYIDPRKRATEEDN